MSKAKVSVKVNHNSNKKTSPKARTFGNHQEQQQAFIFDEVAEIHTSTNQGKKKCATKEFTGCTKLTITSDADMCAYHTSMALSGCRKQSEHNGIYIGGQRLCETCHGKSFQERLTFTAPRDSFHYKSIEDTLFPNGVKDILRDLDGINTSPANSHKKRPYEANNTPPRQHSKTTRFQEDFGEPLDDDMIAAIFASTDEASSQVRRPEKKQRVAEKPRCLIYGCTNTVSEAFSDFMLCGKHVHESQKA